MSHDIQRLGQNPIKLPEDFLAAVAFVIYNYPNSTDQGIAKALSDCFPQHLLHTTDIKAIRAWLVNDRPGQRLMSYVTMMSPMAVKQQKNKLETSLRAAGIL